MSTEPNQAATSDTSITLTGPFRAPKQMLADQSYGGHASVHDDAEAAKLGLAGAPIEGPTHFSQFEPLLAALWGERWFSHGRFSSHFLNMVVEGEEVQATVTSPGLGATLVRADAAKADGTPVLTASASIPDASGHHAESELAPRLAKHQANPPDNLVICDQLSVGQTGAAPHTVVAAYDQHYGALYPFTLADKLASITETISWYTSEGGPSSPWGAPVVPLEMLSVLAHSNSKAVGFLTRQPSVGLFIDLEVELLGRPVLVGHRYRTEHEIVALGESRRTESYWTQTMLIDEADDTPTAKVLLHQGVFKDSYPDYPKS